MIMIVVANVEGAEARLRDHSTLVMFPKALEARDALEASNGLVERRQQNRIGAAGFD